LLQVGLVLTTKAKLIDIKIDLFLTINNNNKPKFRFYGLPITNMILITEYDPPENLTSYHLSTFADIGSSLNDIFSKFFCFSSSIN
jgi:hypothetical protein